MNYWHCHRWSLEVVVVVVIPAFSSKSLLLASWCVFVIGVLSCICLCCILRLVTVKVLLLLSALPLQLKLTCYFLHKLQKFIVESRKVFERVLAILISQQVPSLSKRCIFALANGLARWFIDSYWVRAK